MLQYINRMKLLLLILILCALPLTSATNAYAEKIIILKTSLLDGETLNSTNHEFEFGTYQDIKARSGGRYLKMVYTKPTQDRKHKTYYNIKKKHIDEWFNIEVDTSQLGTKGSIKNSIGFIKYQKLNFDGKSCVFLLATRNGPHSVRPDHGDYEYVGGHRKCRWYVKEVIQAHYCDVNVSSSIPDKDIKSLIMGMSLVNK